jgi:hypothetical protein
VDDGAFKRDMIRLGAFGCVALAAFVGVSLFFARRAHGRMQAVCDERMAPLLSQGARPDAVRRLLGVEGSTYAGHGTVDLAAAVLDKTGPGVDGIRKAAQDAESARVYLVDDVWYFVFYDDGQHVRQYICVQND